MAGARVRRIGDTENNGISGIMSVDNNTVRHIARLARIAVREEELDGLSRELSAILDWVEQLDAVDTSEVPPMTRIVEMRLKTRPDEITDGGDPEALLANAPLAEDGYFVVPKVVE